MTRRGNSKRERERERFERDARQTFGQRARLEAVSHAWSDPRREREEDQRIAARHDPTKPSACRLCAVTVKPTTEALDGWKCCERCRALLAGGLTAVWSELLDTTLTRAELDGMTERGVGNPARFVVGWPTEEGNRGRWEHVKPSTITDARSTLDAVRAKACAGPRPNTYGTGCAVCGVRVSQRWTETPWKFGRNGPRAAACADCAPWASRCSGHDESWRPMLLAACVGMRRAQMGYDLGIKAFWESGWDPAGTDTPWAYLGTTRKELRTAVMRDFPRQLDLTEGERRALALEATMRDIERPTRAPLATIPSHSEGL